MHKRRVNELKLTLTISPTGPILIKAGDDGGLDPTLPSMSFVRTRHPVHGRSTIYLPGASLKGVIRSHSERIIHTVLGEAPEICCDPLDHNHNCASRVKDIKSTAAQYKASCLACRIFGHTAHASHLYTADAYPATPINELPVRQNVAIDRLSGGVSAGPFDMEVALEGAFQTTLTLQNFELWQVGLLALVLRDMIDGRVRLGFAKSRGLGEIGVALDQLEIGYPGQFGAAGKRFETQLFGVSALAPDLSEAYGFTPEDILAYEEPTTLLPQSDTWGRPAVAFAGEAAILPVLAATVPAWVSYSVARQGGG